MDDLIIASAPVATEAPVEAKLPWQTPTVTEFKVADATHATFAGRGGDGGTYS